jgi:hypothetical protein
MANEKSFWDKVVNLLGGVSRGEIKNLKDAMREEIQREIGRYFQDQVSQVYTNGDANDRPSMPSFDAVYLAHRLLSGYLDDRDFENEDRPYVWRKEDDTGSDILLSAVQTILLEYKKKPKYKEIDPKFHGFKNGVSGLNIFITHESDAEFWQSVCENLPDGSKALYICESPELAVDRYPACGKSVSFRPKQMEFEFTGEFKYTYEEPDEAGEEPSDEPEERTEDDRNGGEQA